jgi:putative SOS response-associated peptidase YedK
MCGRYIANSEDEVMEIRQILQLISVRFVVPAAMAEVFPTNEMPIIGDGVVHSAKFGLPKWDGKGVIINAKSETYEQSRFFKPFANNRCIVPAHGYYEWETLPDKKKIKYAFTSDNKHGIFMAGITNQSEFAVITKPAESEMLSIHSRMPLIIPAERALDWLSGSATVAELCKAQSGILWEKAG